MKTNRIAATLLLTCFFTSNISFGQTTFCVGDVSNLSIPRNIGCAAGQGFDVVWDGSGGSNIISNQSSGSSGFTVTWQSTGTFRLKRNFPGGCTGTPLYSPYYTVVAKPATPSASEIYQQPGTCGQVVLNYTGASSGFWQTTSDGQDQTYQTTRTVFSTGIYYLRTINASGCWSSAQSITVNSLPASPVGGTLSGGGTWYGSVNTNLSLSSYSGSIIEYRYTENGGGVNVIGSTSSTLPVSFSAPSSPITRSYWAVIALNGCQTTSSITSVTVNSLPPVSMTACVGQTTSHSIPRNIGCGYGLGYDASFVNNHSGGMINDPGGSESGFTVTWTTPGIYTLQRTFPAQCGTTLIIQTIQVYEKPSTPLVSEVMQQSGTCGQVVLNYTGSLPGFWQTYSDGTEEAYQTTRTVFSTGTYYLRVKNASGCWSSAQSITVGNLPASPVGGTLSGAGTYYGYVNTNLNLIAHSGNIIEYKYSENGSEYVISNSSSTLPVSFSATDSPVTRNYWAVIQLNGCQSTSSVAVVTVNSLPAVSVTACVGQTTSHSIPRNIGCGYGLGYDASFVNNHGGGMINDPGGSESGFTVTWTTPGIYTLQRTFPAGCASTVIIGQTVEVLETPPTPLVSEITQQPGTCGQVVLSYTGSSGSAYWQNNTWETAETYNTIRTVTATQDYHVRIKSSNGCWSDARTVTVSSLPPGPTGGTLSGGGTWYGSVSTNLNLGGQSGSIKEYRYSENGGGAIVVAGTSTPLPVSILNPSSSTVTWQYWAIVQLNGCETSSGTATITINPLPTPNASVSIDNSSICGATIVTQNNPLSPTEQYEWWWQTSSDGTSTELGSSSSATITSSGSLFLRARTKNSPLTWSPGSQSLENIPVFTMPSTPTSGTNTSGFYNNSVILSIGTVPTATSYRWYDNQSGGTLIATTSDNSYNIPNLLSNTPLFVAAVSGGCETLGRFPVTATLVVPQIVLQSENPNIILGQPVVLGVDGVYDFYTWKDKNGIIIGTQATFSTTLPGEYTVTVTKAGMSGTGVSPEFKVRTGPTGQNMNFIVSNSILVEGVTASSTVDALKIESTSQVIQYFDGLGRSIQSVTTQGSPDKKDIVQPIVYDNFGREYRKYLPVVPGSADGWHKTITYDASGNYAGTAGNFYSNNSNGKITQDTRPFSETIFEPSPLNRVLEQGAPGLAWQPDGNNTYTSTDRTVKRSYEFNTTNEVLLWTYTPPADGSLFGKVSARTASAPVYYAANQLYKNKTKDEEHHEVIEYSDKQGKLILKKVQADESGTWAQTYYIYDDFGNQVCVMPPEGTMSALQSLQDAVVNFTANSTWTCPEGVTSITVECWGSGGAGGAVGGNPAAGGGGAGGAYARKVVPVTPGTVYTVTVGAAKGNGGKAATALQNSGNPSWFGNASLVYAQGGTGAAGGQDDNNFNGTGALGSGSSSIGDVVFAGGNGADGVYTSGLAGGAGGGAGGPSSNGGNAVTGTGGTGATGNPNTGNGANGPANNVNGAAGVTYGGGGAGGKANNATDRAGGAGAAGHVRISYDATPATVSNWVFRSAYDHRKRKTINQVPGAQPLYIVYDNRDRVVLTQDGNQRTANRWTFTKYDALNRPVLTGIYTSAPNVNRDSMQVIVNNYYANLGGSKAWFEAFTGNASDVHGYDNKSFPQVANQNDYLTVTYYDNYSFRELWQGAYTYVDEDLSESVNGYTYNQPDIENLRVAGQVTGTKVKVLDGGVTGGYTWLKTINYYDEKYRAIQTISDNYKGGQDRTSALHDFTGKVLKTKTHHTEYDITWKDLVNVTATGNKVYKSAGGNGLSTAGASSKEVLEAGQDGWFEITASESNILRAVGLAEPNTEVSLGSITYSFYLNTNTTLTIYEKGVSKLSMTGGYKTGDRLKIGRTGTTIRYYRNDVLIYTSSLPSVTPLIADAAFNSVNASIVNARSSFSTSSHTITQRSTYDHAGRPLKTYHQVNDEDEVLLNENEYNELGELVTKKLHSEDNGNNFKQHVDYRYNIRGWMTRINDSALTPDDVNEPKDYFGMNLHYNDLDNALGNASYFDGNISAIKWSTNLGLGFNDDELEIFEPTQRAYRFTYDPMRRLKVAAHAEKTTGWNTTQAYLEEVQEYDHNGNIKALTRKGKNGSNMDVLTYNYGTGVTASNQLLSVTDAGDRTQGFKEITATATDYVYNTNGNMVWDRNKGGEELLTNGNFESGSTSWTLTDTGSRLTFADNEVQIIAGSASSVLMQNVLVKSKPYVVVIDIERTAGTLTVYLGGASSNLTATGQHVLSITAGSSTTEFRLTAGTTFAGKIKSVSVKGVTVLTYNYLNQPEIVTQAGDQQLQFIYDATGRKLAQELSKNGTIEQRDDYAGEFIYKNDTLQFIAHEEGRVNMLKSEPIYEYVLRDHLGNTRITFTTKHETETFTATLEDDTFEEEQSNFNNYQRLTNDLLDHTDAGTTYNKALVLNGGYNGQVGLAKSFAVVPGDTIRAKVYAKYLSGTGSTGNLANFALALTGAFGLNSTMTGEAGTMYETLNSFGGIIAAGGRNDEESAPKGFINILVFNKEFELVDFSYQQIDASSVQSGEIKAPHELLSVESVIRQAGYAYVFLSNENATEVQIGFDDYEVQHAHSDVIQQSAYYPFGLTYDDYQKENSLEQRWKFQRQERINAMGLGWDAYRYRNGMPELGRFFNVDPIAEDYYYNSPYAFSENHVTTHVELEGLEKASIHDEVAEANGTNQNTYQKVDGSKRMWNALPGAAGGAVLQTTKLTDVNDATVIVTLFTRKGEAVNVDGTDADKVDIAMAFVGAATPYVSGSAMRRGAIKITGLIMDLVNSNDSNSEKDDSGNKSSNNPSSEKPKENTNTNKDQNPSNSSDKTNTSNDEKKNNSKFN